MVGLGDGAEGHTDEPHYLLTRLLLRRPGKIHPFSSLAIAYSPELGVDGVRRGMRALSGDLEVPPEITEPEVDAPPVARVSVSPPARPRAIPWPPTTPSIARPRKRKSPWSDLPTGLTPAEERADPQLVEAIRESLWASQVGRVELDDNGSVTHPPSPDHRLSPSRSRSCSDTASSSSRAVSNTARLRYDEAFSLAPRFSSPITALARDESPLSLEEIMSSIPADDLRKVARARKVPLSMLATREAVVAALRGVARKQSVLGFAPLKQRPRTQQGSVPFASKATSESLLLVQLLPYLGDAAVQLTASLHALVARVNLIFSRTPPLTSTSSSLLLPSILVTSHKRRYPDYGPPTRSRIWDTRAQLMEWERAVGWEALVADALGDTWAEQRKNPLPGFGVRKEILGRTEGAKVARMVWEGVWPVWKALVGGEGGREVDAGREIGGLVGDRFKTGQWGSLRIGWSMTLSGHVLTRIVYKVWHRLVLTFQVELMIG